MDFATATQCRRADTLSPDNRLTPLFTNSTVPTASPFHRSMVRHEQHLQWLFHGHQSLSRDWLKVHAACDPELADWLILRLRLPGAEQRIAHWPAVWQHQWSGWQLYYQGEYRAAAQQFLQAWPSALADREDRGPATDLALGLGKVYTRSGHWEAARSWILCSLDWARADHRLFAVTEGYGALGELLLRAGQAQAAQTCMGTAYQLLPPGAGQQAKQLNYLASALMRNGALLRSESLLMTSLHMALDQGDTDSVWHTLARLQFLQLQNPEHAQAKDITTTMAAYLPSTRTTVACGFLAIGQALLLARQGLSADAIVAIQVALNDLDGRFPLERIWAQRLLCALQGIAYTPDSELLALTCMTAAQPPVLTSVLDLTWSLLPLPSDNGFAALLGPLQSLEQEALAWHAFFI